MANNNYAYICISVTCFAVLMFTLVFAGTAYIFPYIEAQNFVKTSCFIHNIEFPQTNPSHENSINWETCDCGRKCNSLSPCIKLYSNLSDSYILNSYPEDEKKICTFHNKRCPNGEDIRNILDYLEESNNTFYEFINKTTTCFIDNNTNNIYLYDDTSLTNVIIWSSIMGVTFLCCICIIICFKCSEIREERKRKKENGTNYSV